MTDENTPPAEEHENDPQPHEGDQAKEMIEEGAPSEPEVQVEEVDEIDRELAIFQDLQRLQADFVNYRARVERDRGAERQLAVADTIRAFLPALDDLTRAEAARRSAGRISDGSYCSEAARCRREARP